MKLKLNVATVAALVPAAGRNDDIAPTPGYRGILGLSAGVVRVSGLSARIDPPPPNFGGPLPNALCDRRQ